MDLSRAHRISHEVETFTRDEIVQAIEAIEAVEAIPCDGTAKSYEAIEKAKKILQDADCRLTKLFQGHCPCDRCNTVPTERDERSLFKRIGAIH